MTDEQIAKIIGWTVKWIAPASPLTIEQVRLVVSAAEAEERAACAKICRALRIVTGIPVGQSNQETEYWNKALRDAEQRIVERSNDPAVAPAERGSPPAQS